MSNTIEIDGTSFEVNQVRLITCNTWEDFIQEVRKTRYWKTEQEHLHFGRGAIFRGHANPKWKLSSRLERALLENVGDENDVSGGMNFRALNGIEWYKGKCAEILERFRQQAKGLPGVDISQDDDELWALGRHYGLLTPLLDWTESPYVAAFFALIEFYKRFEFGTALPTKFEGGRVNVWGLRLWESVEEEGVFEILYLRRSHGSRLRAQSGLFTKLNSEQHLDIESYLRSREIAHYLECYELPYEVAMFALRDLDLMNINFSTLFPDLQGAAEQANLEVDILRVNMLRASLRQK